MAEGADADRKNSSSRSGDGVTGTDASRPITDDGSVRPSITGSHSLGDIIAPDISRGAWVHAPAGQHSGDRRIVESRLLRRGAEDKIDFDGRGVVSAVTLTGPHFEQAIEWGKPGAAEVTAFERHLANGEVRRPGADEGRNIPSNGGLRLILDVEGGTVGYRVKWGGSGAGSSIFSREGAELHHNAGPGLEPPDLISELVLSLGVGAVQGVVVGGSRALGGEIAESAVTGAERKADDLLAGLGHAAVSSTDEAVEGALQVAAVEIRHLSEAEYRQALGRAYPAHQLDPVDRLIDDVGQRTALSVVDDPRFVMAMENRDWMTAGNVFHAHAAEHVRNLPRDALPHGWTIEAEYTVRAGKGGSRADVLVQGPGGQLREYDWKTTGKSGLDSVEQMQKHADQISTEITALRGGALGVQESRSWVDYVRPLFRP